MLGEFKFVVYAQDGGWLPNYFGYLFRAAILSKIQAVNPSLSSFFHESNLVRPYALGVPYIRSREKRVFHDRKLLIKSGTGIEFPLRTLATPVTGEMEKSITLFRDLELKIGPVTCAIDTIEVRSEKKPVVGDSSPPPVNYSGLLRFRAPTRFTVQHSPYYSLWPEPLTVLYNLLNIYKNTGTLNGTRKGVDTESFTEQDFFDAVNAYGYVRIVKDWRSRMVTLGGDRRIIGAVGVVEWAFGDGFQQEYLNAVNKLLFFGSFSNTGSNRTAGLGVMECE